MNRDWVQFHLREVEEELRNTIHAIESDPEYGSGDFIVAMTHAYHHLNTAWNSRDESGSRVADCAEHDFFRWRQFPTDDIYMGR